MSYTIDLTIFVDFSGKAGPPKPINDIVDSLLAMGARIDERHLPAEFKISLISEQGGAISFVYKDFEFSFSHVPAKTKYSSVNLSCSNTYFKKDKKEIYLGYFIALSKTIWNAISGRKLYGLADHEAYVMAFEEEKKDVAKLNEPTRFWINFYGDGLVKQIGLEKIAADKDYALENLEGGVMCVMKQTPNQVMP